MLTTKSPKWNYCLVIWLWMFFSCNSLVAQVQEKRFHSITIQDGLSQSTVQTILQDFEGYMWFGTQDGLNKYDGYQMTTYRFNPDDPHSISFSDVRVIYEDKQQNLWVGTHARGMNRFDRDKNRFIRYIGDPDEWETLSTNTVWAMVEDRRGTFWVGTAYGLNIMDREAGTFHRIFSEPDDPNTLSHNQITTLYEDHNGVIWVGTVNGLNRFNHVEETFKRYETFLNGERNTEFGTIRSIYEDKQGNFWIGTENEGLFLMNRDNETFRQYKNQPGNNFSISGNFIFDIIEDSIGNLWLGTGNNGLNIFDREREIFYRYQQQGDNPYSINNNGIQTLYESSDNILWIGTFAGGVNFHDLVSEVFAHYRNEPNNPRSLSNNMVQAIYQGHDENIWIGTDGGGLNLFDPVTGQFRHFTEPGLSSDVILDIHENEQGLWLGTYGGGVDLFKPGEGVVQNFQEQENNPQSLSSIYVFEIFESRDGHLWFGTNRGGITEYDPASGTFTQYLADPEDPYSLDAISNNDIRAIFEDSNGDIWIGTYGGFLERLNRNEGSFTRYDINGQSIFYSSVVQDFHEDSRQRLWIATRGGGLFYYDLQEKELVQFLTTDQFLPSNIVHAIVEDHHGFLWVSTNNGISKVNTETGEVSNYNLEHGLQSREFNQSAALRDSEGYLYFGGVNGFNRFHPDSIQSEETVQRVVLTEFLIYNEPVAIGEDSPLKTHISRAEHIELPYNASVFSFGFAALNFSATKGNEYAYMLEGFDENWNFIGQDRRATYTNLNPGSYTFKVMAANIDGVWGEPSVNLTIQITPPFWRTGWFIGLMIIAVSLLIFLIYRVRVQSIRKRNILLEKEVRERTRELQVSNNTKNKLFSIIAHDLRNLSSGIVGWSGLLKESSETGRSDEVKEYAVYLHQAAIQFSDFLKNLLDWARAQTDQFQYKPKNLGLAKLVETVVSYEELKVKDKKLKISVNVDPETEVHADPDLMSGVFRNLINNALKFTHDGGEINITSEVADHEFVKITISDNGVGMSDDVIKKLLQSDDYLTTKGTSGEGGTGLGFSLCKNFVEKNNGTINIQSELGKGTSVHITLPAATIAETVAI